MLIPADSERNLELAARNNPRLKTVRALGVNIVDLLNYDVLLISEEGLLKLNEVLAR